MKHRILLKCSCVGRVPVQSKGLGQIVPATDVVCRSTFSKLLPHIDVREWSWSHDAIR